MRSACALCALAIALLGSGCKAVRSMINTQPEVQLSRQDYADPAKIVGGTAEVYLPPSTPGWSGDDAALLHRCALGIEALPPPVEKHHPKDVVIVT